MSTIKIYVGCSLTQAPPEFIGAVEAVKASLRHDYEVLDFLGLEHGTAADVFQWDIRRNVAQCDLFVAICDYPSIGLGYELATAIEKLGKPVIALAHQDAKVTRLILGINAPKFSFQRYQSLREVPILIRTKISELNQSGDIL